MKPNNLFESNRFAYLYLRIFGYLPFSVRYADLNEIKAELTVKDLFWFLILIVSYSLPVYKSINGEIQILFSIVKGIIVGKEIAFISIACAKIVAITIDLINRHRITDILKQLHKIDLEVITRELLKKTHIKYGT